MPLGRSCCPAVEAKRPIYLKLCNKQDNVHTPSLSDVSGAQHVELAAIIASAVAAMAPTLLLEDLALPEARSATNPRAIHTPSLSGLVLS